MKLNGYLNLFRPFNRVKQLQYQQAATLIQLSQSLQWLCQFGKHFQFSAVSSSLYSTSNVRSSYHISCLIHQTKARRTTSCNRTGSCSFFNRLLIACFAFHFSSLGYRFTEDQMEPQEQYLKRLSGMQRLYSAILITKQKRELQNLAHPHGPENGWTWFAAFINLEPLPEISATLLLEFLQVCGNEMWQAYRRQFTKLLLSLQTAYMPKLDKVRQRLNLENWRSINFNQISD